MGFSTQKYSERHRKWIFLKYLKCNFTLIAFKESFGWFQWNLEPPPPPPLFSNQRTLAHIKFPKSNKHDMEFAWIKLTSVDLPSELMQFPSETVLMSWQSPLVWAHRASGDVSQTVAAQFCLEEHRACVHSPTGRRTTGDSDCVNAFETPAYGSMLGSPVLIQKPLRSGDCSLV